MVFFCPKRARQGMKMFSSSSLCENDLFIEIILIIGIIFLKNHSKGGKQMEPSISIIIPVYNAEKYVSTCLDSVLAQTLPYLEAIVVDDGSRDSSREIIKQYAAKDDRIVPVFQDNAGPSTARNRALKMAKGEFVAFLDSDDWVEPDAYKEMYNAAIDNNADIVFTSLIWEYDGTGENRIQHYSAPPNRPLTKETIKDVILTDFLYNGAYGQVCKLFRKSLLEENGITFPEGKSLGEDWLFNMEAFTYCNSAFYIDQPYYHYRKSNNTSLMRRYNPELFDSYINHNTLEKYSKRWGLYNEKVAIDLARRKCFIAVNGCIQNEFKPDCKKSMREKLQLISNIVNHPDVQSAAHLSLQHERHLQKKIYLMMLKQKAVLGLFFNGKDVVA